MRDRPVRLPDVLSLVLNPSLFTGAFLLVLASRFEARGTRRLLVGGIGFTFATVLPLLVLIVLRRLGRLTDLEMRVRSERTLVYLWCAAGYLVGLVLCLILRTAHPITALMGLLGPSSLLLAFFNRWSKVSIHTTTLAGLAAIALATFGAPGLFLVAVAGMAAWARWAAGAHSIGELVLGLALGSAAGAIVVTTTHALATR